MKNKSVQLITDGNKKKVIFNYGSLKLFAYSMIFMLLISLAIIISPFYANTTNASSVPLFVKLLLFLICIVIFMVFFPLRSELKRENDGALVIIKTNPFFLKTTLRLNHKNQPYFYGKIFSSILKMYNPTIRYLEGDSEREVTFGLYSLMFFIRGVMPRSFGFLYKEDLEEMSRFMDLKLKIEE